MKTPGSSTTLLLSLTLLAYMRADCTAGPATFQETWGLRYQPVPVQRSVAKRYANDAVSAIRYWNEVALDANALDHTPVAPGENRVFAEQRGPCRSAYALAIVHIAIFDVVNAIAGGYQSYTGLAPASKPISLNAAVAQAAHDTLVALYPSQAGIFAARLAEDLGQIPRGRAELNGIDLGQRAAAAILALRAYDGSQLPEPRLGLDYFPGDQPGDWQQDPISLNPFALGANWSTVAPFVMESGSQFPIPPLPLLDSAEYTAAFDEVNRLGGDGINTPTERTPQQSIIGIYWAYDGTPALGTPPRLYNQIAVQIARQMRSDAVELARLLALVNTGMADAGLAIWESKYHHAFWRPVTAIRAADLDGNPATTADLTFTPLGAPASNLDGPNFTPPFPACPSGHAGFGAVLFQTLRRFYGTDQIQFTFISDECNGVTRDNQGHVRPLIPRTFATLSQAEEENGQSRIYLGVHWAFDKTYGIAQGRAVADYIFQNAFQPIR